MADLSYSVAIEATGAQATLAKLNKQVQGLNSTFGTLKTALAGVAFGSMIGSAIKYADAIQDIANTTGIATQNIIGLNKAVAINGGDSETAQKGVLKLVQTIAEAADGSKSAQNAFEDVGISLRDLATLSEQDILQKTIKGLANVDDASKRLKLTNELLGKGFRTVDLKGLNDDYANAVVQSRQYAASVQSAAKLQDNLTMAVGNFKMSLLQSLKPLIDFVAGLSPQQIQNFTDAVVKIGGAAVGIVGIVKAFQALGIALTAIASYAALAAAGFLSLGTTFAILGKQIGWFTAAFAAATGVMGKFQAVALFIFTLLTKRLSYLLIGLAKITPLIAAVTTTIWAVNEVVKVAFGVDYIDKFITSIGNAYDKFKQFLGLSSEPQKLPDTGAGGGRGKYTQEQINDLNKLGDQQRLQWEQEQAIKRQVSDAYKKQKFEIEKVTGAYKEQNNEIIRILGLETSYIGKSEDIVEVLKAQDDVYKRSKDSIKQLQDQKASLASEDAKLIPIIDAQIAAIQKQAQVDADRIASSIQGLQVAKILEQDRLRVFEDITKQMERQITLSDQLRSANDKMVDIKFEASQRGKSPLEQQFAQIREDARKAASEAGRAFAAGFEDNGDGLSPEKTKELADGLEQIAQRYKQIADAQIENVKASRTFEDGWKQAFNSYMDSATNAAKRAGDIFNAVTNSMESAIDKFVDTGKFSFGDFAESLIKDMIKIELKASAMNLMKMMGGAGGGGGGWLSAIGSVLGFADGGNPPIGRASIVGENGPEMIVPRTASTVIPMKGGSQQVTNNYYTVNAVDAKSVAQLFAENRKTLLGSIKMAEKEMPYRMR